MLEQQNIFQALKHRILVLDGAMGTAIQNKDLNAEHFGGLDFEGCNEHLVLTFPKAIEEIHGSYLKAGCDIIETNTFGGTPLVLDEYGLSEKAFEINYTAAALARKCAQQYSTLEKPRFVAGSIGPTTKAITVTGGITFEKLQEHFYIQAKALYEGGVDYLLLETCQDTRNVKAALLAFEKLFLEKKSRIPVAVSGTIEPMGTMLAGQSIEALMASLAHCELLYLGLNCATGPEFMTDHIRSLSKLSPFAVACVPNAGLPDENGCYLETPEMVSNVLSRFVTQNWVNLVGGCCGTTPAHIEALVKLVQNQKPRKSLLPLNSFLSGVDYLEVTEDIRPVIVGERTNVIGSKKFKTLICEEKFEEASEVARAQIKGGAQVIDICLANPDRNEHQDMQRFLEFAIKKIRAPLMIDSTDEKVIALALTYCQGKAIINSINLEDGEERFEKVVPLAKQYGAALVVGMIDDDPVQGMAITSQRKYAVADRSYKLLTQKYGVLPQDIYWDPLVFPCATGDAQYVGSAVQTIEGVQLLKQKFPGTKTILGISNVSFGLPQTGREVLNSVFLYYCVQAGLDLAIVNAEKLERYASISEEEKKLAEDLLYNRGADPIAAFAAHFRGKKTIKQSLKEKLPLFERLPHYIVEGSKDGLVEDLDEALKTMQPLDIINGPLMKGMDEVGKLFNANQLIVAEVLQSAEAMKAAVSHLEPFMEKSQATSRGKVILATVKGDVHDIGKNLVEIILANNGFQIINLGIKVLPERLIQAIREHNPDIVGLSGLLVKSAQQMAVTASDFTKAGITTPMLVGGAALSSNFVDKQISSVYAGTVAYASDAMHGLELAKTVVDPVRFESLKQELTEKRAKLASTQTSTQDIQSPISQTRSSKITVLDQVPTPSDFERHVLRNTPIEQIWKYINPLMLYGRHLGVKGGIVRQLEKAATDPKLKKELEDTEPRSLAIWEAVQNVKLEFKGTEIMQPSAVFQFFKANSQGNKVLIFKNQTNNGHDFSKAFQTYEFPRQRHPNDLCLADYLYGLSHLPHVNAPDGLSHLPHVNAPVPKDQKDSLAFFIVSVGKGVRELAEFFKNKGDYLKSQILQCLALESAEAYAEYLHAQIRKAWGFPDPPEMTMMERFQAKYRGKRYSFGYPACPKLDDQTLLFELLKPEEIGIQLTDGFMMDPEASVSALVFHHPQATYFSVGHTGDPNEANR